MADLISIAEARERVLAAARPLSPEDVPLDASLGRVLASDARADGDLPPFDSSAMDGYAVVAGPEGELPVVGESRAGSPSDRPLAPGEAMRISTGAAVPEGADAVVPVERVEVSDGRVRVPATEPGDHIRRAGEDARAGQAVIAAGTELDPAGVAVLAALGNATVRCGGVPRVAVLVTGDELVEPGRPLGPGQIRDSNAYGLAAQATRAGARVVSRRVVRDDRDATESAFAAALDEADVVIGSGGVSVGPHDHVKPALAALGVEERFWGVRLKPGKPTWFGTRDEKLVFGLPGNPVSAMVTFHLFARPALRALAGADPVAATRASAVLDVPVPRSPAREQVIRCRLEARDDGWHVAPTKEQGSHVLTSMLGAAAYALVPQGEGDLAAGERVDIELVSWG
ncbi:MAG: molybdopterin molybdotransferase [Thermoleophilaceae bacterium]|jgi:molybdopterin molybdotransferase|nr:molybdopterin molybdotransferase [Thermoleophilaceae bacterium]